MCSKSIFCSMLILALPTFGVVDLLKVLLNVGFGISKSGFDFQSPGEDSNWDLAVMFFCLICCWLALARCLWMLCKSSSWANHCPPLFIMIIGNTAAWHCCRRTSSTIDIIFVCARTRPLSAPSAGEWYVHYGYKSLGTSARRAATLVLKFTQ